MGSRGGVRRGVGSRPGGLSAAGSGVTGGRAGSYRSDPTLGDRVFDLLDVVFPGVRAGRANGAAFGAPWESVSTPFIVEDSGRILAHVGLMPIPLHSLGRTVRCAGVHGVATDPEYRRRGHFRHLMENLLTVGASRFDTLILTTAHREYFEPFGFRVVGESIFRFRSPFEGREPSRVLDLSRREDLSLMHRLLNDRIPVSDVLGVGPETGCWAFYEYQSPIRFLPDADVAVIAELTGPTLRLYDLIGRSVPSIARIVAAFPGPVAEVIAYFAPDRLGGVFVPEPHDQSGGPDALEPGTPGLVFMVRGPLPAEGRLLMLPRPGRC